LSIKRNTIANYIGQGYIIVISIVITPLYLQYLGAEAYGLVGFFALMQAWLNLLDMGLNPTLARQVAYARGQKNGFQFFKRLLKSFELIFFTLAVLVSVSIYFLSEWIAINWIKAETLDLETLQYCIILMGFMIALRLFAGLYRSGVNGLEDQVWLNIINIIVISLKFIGALLLLIFFTQEIQHFFEYQLLIGLLEVAIFVSRFYTKLPATVNSLSIVAFDWQAVKSVAPFALSVAYTAGIWILVTQTDKLILSGILSLTEFGYFSLVALIAGGIIALSSPISQAIMPRMTILLAQNNLEEALNIYRSSSQIVTLISFSLAVVIGLCSEALIYSWTGNVEASKWGKDILIWFALGNGILAIAGFQYLLQTAFGNLKLHVIGSTISAVIQIPIIYYSSLKYGAIGAGVAWFFIRFFWFILWTPIVHNRFLPNFHVKWMLKDIIPLITLVTILTLFLNYFFTFSMTESRLEIFLKIILLGFFVLLISSLSIPILRQNIILILAKYLRKVCNLFRI